MSEHPEPLAEPLVLHVIPTPIGRGAQRMARTLVDRLDAGGPVRHRLLTLFEGPGDVDVDWSLHHRGGDRPAERFDPRLAARLRHGLRRSDPAVVVAHGGDPMKYLVPAVAGTGRSLVYCVIGSYAGPSDRRHPWLWSRLMARADRVVAVGDEVLTESVRRFGADPGRAVMIPNGRDPGVFHPPTTTPATDGVPTVVFVGALTAQKRPGLFIEVCGRLREDGCTFRALLVGDGPLAGTVGPAATRAGVELVGPCPDVASLLRQADILVFPSLPAGEGMPGVLIEAGMSGVPVVAASVPGVSTVVVDGRTGYVVDGSPDSLVAATRRLLDDPDRRATMGGDARRRCVAEFSLDRLAARWRAVLDPLVAGSGR